MKTLSMIFIIHFAGFSNDWSGALRTADSLYQQGEFRKASIQYELSLFLNPDPVFNATTLLKKGECLKQLKEYKQAARTLQRANFSVLPDSLLFEVLYQSALNLYLSENFSDAEINLEKISHFLSDSTMADKAKILHALALNELKKWEEAERLLYSYINNASINAEEKAKWKLLISGLYQKNEQPKFKKLNKAKNLSWFLPGTGQWYVGYFSEGAVNAALQVSSIALTVYLVHLRFFVTGLVAGYGLWQRFYIGAQNRMNFLVDKKNHHLLRNYNDSLKISILELQKQVESNR